MVKLANWQNEQNEMVKLANWQNEQNEMVKLANWQNEQNEMVKLASTINFINLRPIHDIRDTVNVQTYIQKGIRIRIVVKLTIPHQGDGA